MFPFVSSKGVLGMNARNLLYIKPFNPRKAVAFADDKLKTKAFLAARDIPVAKIYARIESRAQLKGFDFSGLPDECVLKPNYGFGGEGIMILKGRKNGKFLEQGKRPVEEGELREHIEDILDGKFSVNGMADTAFFEKILVADECFAPFRPVGLPDIRIVVFNLVPVMAMLRIPTAASGGKANLHMGGIGIGIDIAKGVTTHAVQYNRVIREMPHGVAPGGILLPHWEEMLLISSRIQYITNIGYLAVDLTIDADMGPALLEVNARAGLAVQVANLAPLRARLERVGGIKVSAPEKGVRLAQDLFGEKVRRREDADGGERPVLGTRETIVISGSGVIVEAAALVATDRDRTVFARDLLQELDREGLAETESPEEESYRVKFTLGGRKIQTVVRAGEVADPTVRAVIGRRDLTGFLIDPSRAEAPSVVRSPVRDDLRAIDNLLSQIDRDLLLLKFLKPVNLAEERERIAMDTRYQPQFTYRPVEADLDEIEGRLVELSPDDSPVGTLFKKKRRELLLRVNLLRARGNARMLTEASAALFGLPTADLLTAAAAVLASRTACDLPPPDGELLSAEEAAAEFQTVLERFGLHDWQISVRPHLVADCTVGGRTVYVRAGARFSKEHVASLVAHEIETHVLTAENGLHQPFDLFRAGFAHYLDTQEGLAIFNQNRVLSPHHEKRYGPARNVLATAYALEHSFADTRAYLERELGYAPDKAIGKAIDLKRGIERTEEAGGFTKGLVYFRGQSAIERFVAGGGDLKRLYVGKIPIEDLEVIEQIPGLRPAILIPDFLRDKQGKGRKGRG